MSNKTPTIPPKEFSDDIFLRKNAAFIQEYVRLRKRNVPAQTAMTRVFGSNQDDELISQRIRRLEGTEVYCQSLERAIHGPSGAKAEWNAAQAVWDLRERVNDQSVSPQARNTAIRELNVLHSLTVIDPAGNTRAGSSLSDFYAKEGKLSANAPGTQSNPHRLPDDIETPLQEADPTPPDAAMPQAPDPIPPAHQQFIADVLEPVKPRPVTQTRQLVPFERLKVVQR